jgi:glycosyltransferase involved in cell wall biosynthesis
MTVGIVVPTFNREQLLPITIAAVQAQTLHNWRLVLVDDGSADRTVEVARQAATSDPRIHVVMQSHGGIAAARNRGMEHLDDAELVIFLDDDDLWEPDTLQRLSGALERDTRAVGAYGLARAIDLNGQPLRNDALMDRQTRRRGTRGTGLIEWPASEPTTFEVMAFGNVIMTPGTVLIRRSALGHAGRFREPAADWNMWLRLTMQGHLVFLPEVVIGYRSHPGNESRSILRNSRRKLLVHWRLLWSADLTRSQRRAAWLGFVYYYADLSRTGRTLRRLLGRSARGGPAPGS